MSKVTVGTILRAYGEKAAQAAREALMENAKTLVEEAKQRCPVKTGTLQGSIHPEQKNKNTILVVADAQAKDGYYYGRLIEYSPYGQSFLRPALEAKLEEMHQHTLDKIREALRQ